MARVIAGRHARRNEIRLTFGDIKQVLRHMLEQEDRVQAALPAGRHEGIAARGYPSGLQRVGVLVCAPAVLASLGADPDEVAALAGLNPAALRHPDNRIPLMQLGRYVALSVERTGCRTFGLLVGEHGSLAELDPLGRLMREAPTLGAALGDLVANHARTASGAIVYLIRDYSTAHLGYALDQPGVPAAHQICAGAIALATRIVGELGFAPTEILLSQATPDDPEERAQYRRILGVPVHFDADVSALVFPAHALSRPIRGADPKLRARIEAAFREEWARQDGDLARTVLRTLASRVTWGKVSLPETARRLGLHPRTLDRRLRELGTGFSEIRDAARFEVARQLLLSTGLSVGQIGAAFGYAETALFNRAFLKWAGLSPSAWREGARQEPAGC